VEIEVVAFISDGRPERVNGCLSAYAKNFAGYGRKPLIVLADSSADPVSRNLGREALFNIHREHGFEVRHISNREVDSFLRHVDDSLSSCIGYAVNGDWRIGLQEEAVYNRALIACAGRPAMFVNIETMPDLSSAPGANPCLAAKPPVRSDLFDPYGYEVGSSSVFADEATAEKMPRLHRADILSLMDDHLGKSFESCAEGHDHSLGKADGTVHVTQMGLWGDARLPYSTGRYLTSVGAMNKWAGDEDSYLSHRGSRYGQRVAGDWVATRSPTLGRDLFALSPLSIQAPFLPTGESSSRCSLPGLMNSLFGRKALAVEVPFAVRRKTGDEQTFSPDSHIRGAERMSFHDLVLVLSTIASEGGDVRSVGAFLRDAADYTGDALSVLLRTAGRSWARQMRGRVEAARNRYTGTSATAASDLQALIDTYTQMLDSDDYSMPYEIRSGTYSFESDRILRRQLRQYGELLINWRSIINNTMVLRGQGIEIGTKP